MKKILLLASAVTLPFLVTSCADYATYGYGTVGAPVGGFGNPGFVGGELAPLQVGFVATSFDRWAWDPWRRHYFDRSCGRYWNPGIRNYYSVTPRRFSSPIYPTGFRRGQSLACPAFLPRTPVIVDRGRSSRSVGVVSNHGRYASVIHGQSRGVTSVRPSSNDRLRSSLSSRSSNSYHPSSDVTPTRRSSSSSTQRSSGSSRYQTVSSSPGRTISTPTIRSTPTVRSSSYTPKSSSSVGSYSRSASTRSTSSRSTPSRSTPSRSTSSRSTPSRSTPSRSTSSPSRSVSKARQRTR